MQCRVGRGKLERRKKEIIGAYLGSLWQSTAKNIFISYNRIIFEMFKTDKGVELDCTVNFVVPL